jgi:hypothetical protein
LPVFQPMMDHPDNYCNNIMGLIFYLER